MLWIISAGAPTTVLTELRPARAPGWPAGVYFLGASILRVGIVVASELPRDRTTLLVRLMAAGPLLAPAVNEVKALPPDAPERIVAEPVLLSFQRVLGQVPERHPDEQEFIMAMLKGWEYAKAEGRAEARIEARASDVLTVLRVRGIVVSDRVRERILAETDLERLGRWLEKAAVATSLADVLDEPR